MHSAAFLLLPIRVAEPRTLCKQQTNTRSAWAQQLLPTLYLPGRCPAAPTALQPPADQRLDFPCRIRDLSPADAETKSSSKSSDRGKGRAAAHPIRLTSTPSADCRPAARGTRSGGRRGSSLAAMDEAALYGFDVRGYTVLPSLLDVGQLAELNAEVPALCALCPHPPPRHGWKGGPCTLGGAPVPSRRPGTARRWTGGSRWRWRRPTPPSSGATATP